MPSKNYDKTYRKFCNRKVKNADANVRDKQRDAFLSVVRFVCNIAKLNLKCAISVKFECLIITRQCTSSLLINTRIDWVCAKFCFAFRYLLYRLNLKCFICKCSLQIMPRSVANSHTRLLILDVFHAGYFDYYIYQVTSLYRSEINNSKKSSIHNYRMTFFHSNSKHKIKTKTKY